MQAIDAFVLWDDKGQSADVVRKQGKIIYEGRASMKSAVQRISSHFLLQPRKTTAGQQEVGSISWKLLPAQAITAIFQFCDAIRWTNYVMQLWISAVIIKHIEWKNTFLVSKDLAPIYSF